MFKFEDLKQGTELKCPGDPPVLGIVMFINPDGALIKWNCNAGPHWYPKETYIWNWTIIKPKIKQYIFSYQYKIDSYNPRKIHSCIFETEYEASKEHLKFVRSSVISWATLIVCVEYDPDINLVT